MQSYYIEVDKADLKYVTKKLQNAEKNAPKVLRNAINRTATQTMKMLREGRSQGYVIKAGAFSGKIKKQTANMAHLDATIKVQDGAHGVLKGAGEGYYKVSSSSRSGAKVSVLKGGRKSLVNSAGNKAFYAKMKSGHEGLFQRVGKPRLSIREVVGPGVAKMALSIYKGKRGGQGDMEPKIRERLHDEIRKEIEKLI